MNSHIVKFLRSAYKAYNARDIDSALSFMQHDVSWPNGIDGGYVHGHNAIREYWTEQWKTIDPHIEPQQFQLGEDGSVIVTVHQLVRDVRGNVLRDDKIQHVYTMHRGLVKSMTIREHIDESSSDAY